MRRLPMNRGRLMDILRTPRGNHTSIKTWFPKWVSEWAPSVTFEVDIIGNLHFNVPTKEGTRSKVLWCAHYDTVDDSNVSTQYKKKLTVSKGDIVGLHPTCTEYCLGADDAAGVEAILCMVEAGVPGQYALFIGEEVGCLGSSAYADYLASKDNTSGISFGVCISLDRRGTSDLITYQGGVTRASKEASAYMIEHLFPSYKEAKGVWTDSAALPGIESFNLSMGYRDEHTKWETLNVKHLRYVIDTLVTKGHLVENIPVIGPPPAPPEEEYPNFTTYSGYRKRTSDQLLDVIYFYPTEASRIIRDMGLEDEFLRAYLERGTRQ